MSHVTLIVTMWLVLSAGIADEMLVGDRARLALVLLCAGATVLMGLAVYVELPRVSGRREQMASRRVPDSAPAPGGPEPTL